MKTPLIKLSIILFIYSTLLSLTSCSAIKKRYSSGFHIEWNKREKVVSTEKKLDKKSFASTINDTLVKKQIKKTEPIVLKLSDKSDVIVNSDKEKNNELTASLHSSIVLKKNSSAKATSFQAFSHLKSSVDLKRKKIKNKVTGINRGDETVMSKILFYIACTLLIVSAILMLLVIESELEVLWFIAVGLFLFTAVIGLFNKLSGGDDWSFENLDVAQIIVAIFSAAAVFVVTIGLLFGIASFFLGF